MFDNLLDIFAPWPRNGAQLDCRRLRIMQMTIFVFISRSSHTYECAQSSRTLACINVFWIIGGMHYIRRLFWDKCLRVLHCFQQLVGFLRFTGSCHLIYCNCFLANDSINIEMCQRLLVLLLLILKSFNLVCVRPVVSFVTSFILLIFDTKHLLTLRWWYSSTWLVSDWREPVFSLPHGLSACANGGSSWMASRYWWRGVAVTNTSTNSQSSSNPLASNGNLVFPFEISLVKQQATNYFLINQQATELISVCPCHCLWTRCL